MKSLHIEEPAFNAGQHKKGKLGAFGEAGDQRKLLVTVQAATTRPERIDVRTAGGGEIVAFTHSARGLEFEVETERLAGAMRPRGHRALLIVERLWRTGEAAVQMHADAVARGCSRGDCFHLRFSPDRTLGVRHAHIEAQHGAFRDNVDGAAAVDRADIERHACALAVERVERKRCIGCGEYRAAAIVERAPDVCSATMQRQAIVCRSLARIDKCAVG